MTCAQNTGTLILIEEKNPLKQGLKPDYPGHAELFRKIEEKNPLKQGLKPGRLADGSARIIN